MTAQHTPGPWRIAPDMHGIGNNLVAGVIDATGYAIANCGSSGNANARLIAAAPELLAALQWVVECFDGDPSDNPDWQYQDQSHAVDRAKLAIAKATGSTE